MSSYREVDDKLGTMEQLSQLAREMRQAGISLVVDLVFNHTSHEHDWAQNAIAGDPDYQEYYRIFPDRKIPDQYEKNLREIFPGEHPGAFTYWPDLQQWVWTTFHSYQWDLNYANPVVFNRMAEEMLFLGQPGRRSAAIGCCGFHLETNGHILRKSAPGTLVDPGVQRRGAYCCRRLYCSSPRRSSIRMR